MASELPEWELLPELIGLSEEAGECILGFYRRQSEAVEVQYKENRTPLTEADMAAHHLIEAGLQRLTPGLPVLSEESEAIPFAERTRWGRYWLVDPLDGTKEFIKGNGEFTVNIALVEGHRAILGVIHGPVNGVTYYAGVGRGAYRRRRDAAPEPIRVRPLQPGRFTVAGSRSHVSRTFQRFLGNLGGCDVIPMGSSLKSCLVAEGSADVYPRFGPTCEWDTAAAQCVVEEAGGALVDTDMQPLRYNTKDSLLNPHFLAVGDAGYPWPRYLPGA